MTIKVLEHEGLYTAYRLIIRRGDDGRLFESVKQIDIPFPPVEGSWRGWAESLDLDQLEVGLQVYFDKWNFGNGSDEEQVLYTILCDEQERRRLMGDKTGQHIKSIKSITQAQVIAAKSATKMAWDKELKKP